MVRIETRVTAITGGLGGVLPKQEGWYADDVVAPTHTWSPDGLEHRFLREGTYLTVLIVDESSYP